MLKNVPSYIGFKLYFSMKHFLILSLGLFPVFLHSSKEVFLFISDVNKNICIYILYVITIFIYIKYKSSHSEIGSNEDNHYKHLKILIELFYWFLNYNNQKTLTFLFCILF